MNNIDRNIRRLLNSIGTLEAKAKVYNSNYYKVIHPDGLEIKIRLSDHFSDHRHRDLLHIVHTNSGFYTIKDDITGFSVTLTSADIVLYLKSFIIVYPEIRKQLITFREALKQQDRISNQRSDRLNKLTEDLESLRGEFDKYLATYTEPFVQERNELKVALKERNIKINAQAQEIAKYKKIVKQINNIMRAPE